MKDHASTISHEAKTTVWEAQIPIAWVVGDTVYGENLDLRTWLQRHGYSYVLEVWS